MGKAEARPSMFWTVLGLSPVRVFWGTRGADCGLVCCIRRIAWFEDLHEKSHGEGEHIVESFWHARLTAVPTLRHIWGDKQASLHAGGQELFVDLIFVAAAYRVGEVLKLCIYSCAAPGVVGGVEAAATNASHVVASHARALASAYFTENECIGLGLAVLHSLAPFVCMYSLWDIEKRHRAMYEVSSKTHVMLDWLTDFLLIAASMDMQPANAYRSRRHPSLGLSRVLIPITGAFCVWMARIAEIALLSTRECARRQSSVELITCCQILVLWGGALVLSMHDFGDPLTNARMSDCAAALMWIGNLWWLWKQAFRSLIKLALSGSLPLERMQVCANAGFNIHRNNEFMFLMLGETVLQIVVAIAPRAEAASDGEPFVTVRVGTAGVGFVIAMFMMFFFRIMVSGQLTSYGKTNRGLANQTEEHDQLLSHFGATAVKRMPTRRLSTAACMNRMASAQIAPKDPARTADDASADGGGNANSPESPSKRRSGGNSATAALKKFVDVNVLTGGDAKLEARSEKVLVKMYLYNVLNSLLWEVNAVAVMLVGIGVKLAIIDPLAAPDGYSAFAQRLEVSASLAVVMSVQLFHTLFVKTFHHYSYHTFSEQPVHVLVVALRAIVIVACAASCMLPLSPLYMLILLAGLSAAQYVLLHIQESLVPVVSIHQHPMRELPNSLFVLQQRRKRHLHAAKEGGGGGGGPRGVVYTDVVPMAGAQPTDH